jgi:hypothetical protein
MTQVAEAAPAPIKAPKVEQNGVSRPGAGTATEKVWAIADAQSIAAKAPAKRAEVLKEAEANGINLTTAATQFGKWCKFNGVKPTPAIKVEKPAKEPKAPKAKKEKAAAVAPEAVPV